MNAMETESDWLTAHQPPKGLKPAETQDRYRNLRVAGVLKLKKGQQVS